VHASQAREVRGVFSVLGHGSDLASLPFVELDRMLERCRRLEERVGAVYRSFAASARADPPLCALWTALAREEAVHARSIASVLSSLDGATGWHTVIDGWEDAVAAVEERLRHAEELGPAATTANQLAVALEIELSELESLRQALLVASDRTEPDTSPDHATRLADAAARMSDDPHVRLQAALLRARARLAPH
jgi:hypothetical protein